MAHHQPATGETTLTPNLSVGMGTGRYRTALLMILVATALIDLFFFTGFFSSDDIGYFASADHVRVEGAAPEFTPLGSPAVLRATVLGWSLLVMWMFGPHVQLVACSFLVFHLLLIQSVALLSARLFDRRVALVAAWFTATCPLFVTYSTTILPDLQLACCFVLSLYAYMRAYDPTCSTRSTKFAWGWMLLAGVLSGGAYLAKESGLILLPFYFVLWIVSSRWRTLKSAVWIGSAFAIGVAAVFALEFLLWSALLHHSYVRMDWTVKELEPATRAHIARYSSDPIIRLGWAGRRLNEFFSYLPMPVLCVLAVVPILYCILPRRRYAVLAMAVWTFAFLTWGTMRLTEYFPPSIKARYYIPVIPFLCMMVAFVAVAIADRAAVFVTSLRARRWSPGALTASILIFPLFGLGISNEYAGRLYRAENVRNCIAAIQFAVAQADDLPIVFSPYVERRMECFFADGRPARVVASEEVTFDDPKKLLELGELYFISTRRPYKGFVPNHPLDELIDLESRGTFLASAWRQAFGKATVCWFPGESDRTLLVFPGMDVTISKIGWFEAPPTRWHSLLLNIGNSASIAFSPNKLSARSVGLFKVKATARPKSTGREGNTISLPPPETDLLGDGRRWNISSATSGSAPSGAAKTGEETPLPIERIGNRIRLNLAGKESRWFFPSRDLIRTDGALVGAGRYEVRFEGAVEGPAAVELRFDAYADSRCTKLVMRKRMKVRKSTIVFQLQTETPILFIKPAFKVSGKGTFEAKRISVTRVDG